MIIDLSLKRIWLWWALACFVSYDGWIISVRNAASSRSTRMLSSGWARTTFLFCSHRPFSIHFPFHALQSFSVFPVPTDAMWFTTGKVIRLYISILAFLCSLTVYLDRYCRRRCHHQSYCCEYYSELHAAVWALSFLLIFYYKLFF